MYYLCHNTVFGEWTVWETIEGTETVLRHVQIIHRELPETLARRLRGLTTATLRGRVDDTPIAHLRPLFKASSDDMDTLIGAAAILVMGDNS